MLPVRVEAGASGVAAACAYLAGHLEGVPVSARAHYRLELVVEELLMNVAMHGGDGAGPAVTGRVADVSLAVLPEWLLLRVEDDGPTFNPTTAVPPPLPGSVEAARPGGLGLRLVRQAVQDWRHERVGERNRLTVTIARD